MQYMWQYSDAHRCRYTVKTWGDKSGKTCVITSLQHAYSTHCTGQRSRLITAHGGHTEEWTVVMGYLCIQPKWLLLMHIHTSNLHMSSLCSNPIVPEAATRYTDHYKLLTSPPHPSMYLPAIQLITCYKLHVDSYANSRGWPGVTPALLCTIGHMPYAAAHQ